MKSTVLIYVNRFRHDRHERLVLGFVLLILAMFVTMTVYWQLRYTGITMTNETYCGIEEHIHTDECYESVLVCGYEDGEIEIAEGTHVHTDECYLSESVLVCGLEEDEEHTHTAECYEVQQILICGYEEATVHVHTDECYELQLTCGLEEHTHSIECMIDESADLEDATIWEATLPELTGELRTDVVSIAQSQLGYTESTANYTIADDESHNGYTRYGAWYGNEYGSWDTMFAAFCLHYAGIDETEFPVNSGAFAWAVQLSELGRYVDATDYTPTMGDIVFFDSDGDERVDRVGIVTAVDESAGMVTVIEGDYTAGDVDTVCEHIYPLTNSTIIAYGVLPEQEEEATSDETTDDEVTIDEESTDEAADDMDEDTVIDGETDSETDGETETEETEELEEGVWVVTDSEETEDDVEDAEETEQAADVTVFTASDSDVNVTVIAPNGALPDNAVLSVTLVDEESEEYQAAAEAVGYENTSTTEETTETSDENAIATISDEESADETETTEESGTSLAVLDISFTVDGVEVEPTEAVTVIIDASSLMTDDADASTLEVQHLEETEEGITPVLVADATDDTEGTVYADAAVAEFTVEGFSYFTIQWGTGQNKKTVYVYVYDTDDNDLSTYTTGTTTFNNNATVTLEDLCTIDGYTFDHADVSYTDGNGYGSTTKTLEDVYSVKYSSGYNGGYTITYDSGSTTSIDGNKDITIKLYFASSSSSSSTFGIVWHASGASSLSVSTSSYFDTDGSGTYVIDDGTLGLSAYDIGDTLYVGYDNEVDFDDNNALLAVSGYDLKSATLYVDGSTTGIEGVVSIKSVYTWPSNQVAGYWTYYYTKDGTNWVSLGSSVTSLDVDLYYEIEDTAITGDLTISDDIANSGSIVATYTGSGTVDHYIWYQYDSDSGTWSQVSGEYNDSLEVYEDGARQIYRVQAIDSSGNVLATSASYQVPYYDQLQNGSFEYPDISGNIQITNNLYYEYVWQTTGEGTGTKAGQDLEIVDAAGSGSSYGETTAADGYQYAELNCETAGTLYQDVMTIPDVPLYWNFAHEGRDGTDTMCVIIVDASYAEANITTQAQVTAIYNAAVQAAGGSLTAITEGEYSTGSVTFYYDGVPITLWLITSDNDTWHSYYGEYTVPDDQYLTRFLFASVSGSTTGNLIDGISFSQTAPVSDDSVNITVTKVVSGLDEDEVVAAGTYTFEVYNSKGDCVGTIALPFANATASQTAYWTYTFTELTADSGFYVVETINNDISGYTHSSTSSVISAANGIGTYTSASFALSNGESSVVTFTNTYIEDQTYSGGPEMPETGGGGTKLYTMVGILLICSASYLLYRLKQQRHLKQQKRKCKWRWNI